MSEPESIESNQQQAPSGTAPDNHPAPNESAQAPSVGFESRAKEPKNLLAVTGPAYFPIALIARFPYAMMVVGTLTLVVAARGSLSLGGWTSAAVGLGAACCGPLIGAAADRWGQRHVLLFVGAINSTFLLLLTAAVYSPLENWVVLLAAFFVGASAPQVPPMTRTRLVGLIGSSFPAYRRQKTMNRTMAYESAADEIVFVFGPILVGGLAALFGPAAPMITAAVLTLIFLTAFALHRSSAWVPKHSDGQVAPAPKRELLRPALLVAVFGVLGVGLLFGTSLTSITSFMADVGQPERAGLLYASMGVGSAVLALAAALFPAKFTLRARWLVFGSIILAGTIYLQFATDVPHLILALLLIGLGIGPTLVTLFSLVAQRSPHGRSATAMSLATTGIVVGQSSASAITGEVGERLGTDAALIMPIIAATAIVIAALLNSFAREPESF